MKSVHKAMIDQEKFDFSACMSILAKVDFDVQFQTKKQYMSRIISGY